MVTPLLLEAYVFRRAVCAIPSNSQQKTFATFSRALRRENCHYLPSFKAHLLALPSYRRFPSDEEFRREIQIRNLYKFNKSCSYWLHRLGNLTLTGYNREMGDRPFLDKRDGNGGFAKSPLHLNESLGQLERWDVDAMRLRGERLADRALAVWPAPQLREEQRLAYQPSRSHPPVPPQHALRGTGQSKGPRQECGRNWPLEDLPYALGLIRQSLERQLDDTPEAL
jgi:hypothetical protein